MDYHTACHYVSERAQVRQTMDRFAKRLAGEEHRTGTRREVGYLSGPGGHGKPFAAELVIPLTELPDRK